MRPLHVQHPWVHYRRKHYPLKTAEERKGTLAYFPHTNPNTDLNFDVDKYISQLCALPREFQPIVICLMVHDVKKDLHEHLRKYDMPLVTAGNTNSQYFVDNFYTLAGNFRYTTSPEIGSHTFYLIEAGIPFFLLGDKTSRTVTKATVNRTEGQIINEISNLSSEDFSIFNEIQAALAEPSAEVTTQQRDIAQELLGIAAPTTAVELRKLFWQEFRAHLGEAVRLYSGWSKAMGASVIKRAMGSRK